MSTMVVTNCTFLYGGNVPCKMRGWTRKKPPKQYICKKHWKDPKSLVKHPKRAKHKSASTQSNQKKKKKG